MVTVEHSSFSSGFEKDGVCLFTFLISMKYQALSLNRIFYTITYINWKMELLWTELAAVPSVEELNEDGWMMGGLPHIITCINKSNYS